MIFICAATFKLKLTTIRFISKITKTGNCRLANIQIFDCIILNESVIKSSSISSPFIG